MGTTQSEEYERYRPETEESEEQRENTRKPVLPKEKLRHQREKRNGPIVEEPDDERSSPKPKERKNEPEGRRMSTERVRIKETQQYSKADFHEQNGQKFHINSRDNGDQNSRHPHAPLDIGYKGRIGYGHSRYVDESNRYLTYKKADKLDQQKEYHVKPDEPWINSRQKPISKPRTSNNHTVHIPPSLKVNIQNDVIKRNDKNSMGRVKPTEKPSGYVLVRRTLNDVSAHDQDSRGTYDSEKNRDHSFQNSQTKEKNSQGTREYPEPTPEDVNVWLKSGRVWND